eukprot:4498632-Amphidinium_carterae.1
MVAVAVVAKGRSSSSRLNRVLRQLSGLLVQHEIMLDVVWVPTWANPSDAPSRGKSLASWLSSLPEEIECHSACTRVPPHTVDAWRRVLQTSSLYDGRTDLLERWRVHVDAENRCDARPPKSFSTWRKGWILTCGD